MTKPAIRVATTVDGDIEATCRNVDSPRFPFRVVIDRRLGYLKDFNTRDGDTYRWLITEARKHVNRG